MGDAWVSSDGGMLTLDTGALHTKWIRDIYDEQARSIAAGQGGCAPNIAPVSTQSPPLPARPRRRRPPEVTYPRN